MAMAKEIIEVVRTAAAEVAVAVLVNVVVHDEIK